MTLSSRRLIPSCRAACLAVSLALVMSLSVALSSGASAQAAHPRNMVFPCLACSAPSIGVTTHYMGDLTVSGQSFTPGGMVTIVASMPADGMGGGGVTSVTTQASYPGWTCTSRSCVYSAGGTFVTTFNITFSCGGGVTPVTVRAQDLTTGAWSNSVATMPWSTC